MKKILAAGMMVLASAGSAPALAQDFPNHPIRLIIPYSAGGVTDVVGRALAEQSGKRLGQTVVVENKTGANGTLGATQMLNTAPDGYTVTMVPIGIFRMPHITGTRYDPVKDLTYISMIAGSTTTSRSPRTRPGRRWTTWSPTPSPSPTRFPMARRAPTAASTSPWCSWAKPPKPSGPTCRTRATPTR